MCVKAGTKEDSCGQRSAGDRPCKPLRLSSALSAFPPPVILPRLSGASAANSTLVCFDSVKSTCLEVLSGFIKGKKGQTFSKCSPSFDLMTNIVRYC